MAKKIKDELTEMVDKETISEEVKEETRPISEDEFEETKPEEVKEETKTAIDEPETKPSDPSIVKMRSEEFASQYKGEGNTTYSTILNGVMKEIPISKDGVIEADKSWVQELELTGFKEVLE